MASGDRDPENRGRGRGPNDGRGPCGLAHRPNSRDRSALRHDGVQPSERRGMQAGSNIRHAIYSGYRRDTNSRLARRIPVQDATGECERLAAAVAGRY